VSKIIFFKIYFTHVKTIKGEFKCVAITPITTVIVVVVIQTIDAITTATTIVAMDVKILL